AVSAFVFCVFFFSSRRRHTRFSRDWSSDVCSSDLNECGRAKPGAEAAVDIAGDTRPAELIAPESADLNRLVVGKDDPIPADHHRSEERRVGKECRYRWSPEQ